MSLNKRDLFLVGCFAFGAGFLSSKLAAAKYESGNSGSGGTNLLSRPPRRSRESELNLRVDYHRLKSIIGGSSVNLKALDGGIPGVFRLVLTGGPCAGKSTIISTLSSYLRSKGFAVIHVPESATALKNTGINWAPDLSDDFQDCVVNVQANRENVAVSWAQKLAAKCVKKKCIVIYDRGLVDGMAFVPKQVLDKSCQRAKISTDLFQRYDCVFHLVTAADGAPEFYEKTSYRHESPEDAVKQDKVLQEVWKGHPNHFIFMNAGTFQEKIERVINKLCACLGIMSLQKQPQRFLLNKIPDIPSTQNCFSENYLKIYINSPWQEAGYVCSFIRKSERKHEEYVCVEYVFKTVLNKGGQTIEKKRRLTKAEFDMYCKLQEKDRHKVKQKRIYITVPNQVFLEITCYEKPSKGVCLLNVYKVTGEDFDISSLPEFVKKNIVKDVTDDQHYSAHYLSLKNPPV